jgi:hypothetical protein
MDHFEALHEKVERLRVEIAEIQYLNERFRRYDRDKIDAQIAHSRRHERLEAIQQELSQLADLGRKVLSVEETKAKHLSRPFLVKKVS